MRRGASRREWTVAEERYLVESAGRVPRSEICRELRRSAASVYAKAAQLRRRGYVVDLRSFAPNGEPCPACGQVRSRMRPEGVCQLCWERTALGQEQAEIAALLLRLPPDQREVYMGTEAETGSRADPLPPPPDLPEGTTRYARARARDEWLCACEEVEIANAHRRLKAAQKRKNRIWKKCEQGEINAKKLVSPDEDDEMEDEE